MSLRPRRSSAPARKPSVQAPAAPTRMRRAPAKGHQPKSTKWLSPKKAPEASMATVDLSPASAEYVGYSGQSALYEVPDGTVALFWGRALAEVTGSRPGLNS